MPSPAQRTKPRPNPCRRLRVALRKIAGACLEFLVVLRAVFQDSTFVRDSNAVVANPGENGAPRFGRQHFRSKYSRGFSWKKLYEQRRNVCRGIRHGRGKPPLLADLIQRSEHAVASY